jgi:hypothetical protein
MQLQLFLYINIGILHIHRLFANKSMEKIGDHTNINKLKFRMADWLIYGSKALHTKYVFIRKYSLLTGRNMAWAAGGGEGSASSAPCDAAQTSPLEGCYTAYNC